MQMNIQKLVNRCKIFWKEKSILKTFYLLNLLGLNIITKIYDYWKDQIDKYVVKKLIKLD